MTRDVITRQGPRALLVLSVLGVNLILSPPSAFAHCPGGATNLYVAGGNGNNVVHSVRTKIEWMGSSNVCSSGASYSISIVNSSGGTGWLQVGWRYYSGYSSPKGYCERAPQPDGTGSYALTEYTVDPKEQWYTYFHNNVQQFECRIDGETLKITHNDFLGFSQGSWVPVQAEAHAPHVQLGRIAPNWLYFHDAEKIPTSANTWSNMQVEGAHSDAPVWNWTQPGAGGLGVNTDANH